MDMLDILLVAGAVVFFIIAFLFLKRRKGQHVQATKANSGAWVLKAHQIYRAIPLLNKYYNRVYGRVQQMYPADLFSVIKKTVSMVTKAYAFFFAAIIFTLLIAGGDVLYILTGCLTAYALMTNTISNRLAKYENALLVQLQGFLETLRYHYNECGAVDEAIDMCREDMPYELSLHIDKIYEVITSVDIDESIERYTQEPNNKFFLMLSSICATVMRQGDRPLKEGVSVFLNNIKHLQEELNVEILKRKMIEKQFAAVSWFCVLPVFALKPIEIWAQNNQAEMMEYYTGAYGTVVMFAIFFIATIGNSMIDNLKNGATEENEKFWNKIANLPILKNLIHAEINVHYSKAQKLYDSLKRIGSTLSANEFYAKKVVYGLGCMILFNAVVLISTYSEKSNLLHDFDNAFSTSYAVDEEYVAVLQRTAEEEVKFHMRDSQLTEEELNQQIIDDLTADGTISSTTMIEEVAEVVTERVTDYQSTYYKWWFMIITFVAGLVGAKIPDWMLRSKKKALEMDMEDEVIQFQAIALIMMHIKESTVEGTLEWMEKFARCFKFSITKCIMNLDSGEVQALEQLKDDEPAPQFQKIINSLINVDKVGMEAAFDSVETERTFLRDKRKMDNEEVIRKKSAKAWRIAFGVLFSIVGLWLIGPMLLMGASMITDMLALMNTV